MVGMSMQLMMQHGGLNMSDSQIKLYNLCSEQPIYKSLKKGDKITLYLGNAFFHNDPLIAQMNNYSGFDSDNDSDTYALSLNDVIEKLAKEEEVLKLGWNVNFVSFDAVQIGSNEVLTPHGFSYFFNEGPSSLYRVPHKVLFRFAELYVQNLKNFSLIG